MASEAEVSELAVIENRQNDAWFNYGSQQSLRSRFVEARLQPADGPP